MTAPAADSIITISTVIRILNHDLFVNLEDNAKRQYMRPRHVAILIVVPATPWSNGVNPSWFSGPTPNEAAAPISTIAAAI